MAADNKNCIASEEGVVVVLDAGAKLSVLATNKLDGAILATPALVDRQIRSTASSRAGMVIAAPSARRSSKKEEPTGEPEQRERNRQDPRPFHREINALSLGEWVV